MAYMEGEISYKRIAAYAIDTSFVMMVCLLLISTTQYIPDAGLFKALLVIFMLFVGYILPYTLWKGQTYGKKSQKIVLMNMDGSDCKMVKIIFREIFKMILAITTFGGYCVVAGIIMLFRKDERTIHDFIFRTKVEEKVLIQKNIKREDD